MAVFRQFYQLYLLNKEVAGGCVLLFCALIALFISNSSVSHLYVALLDSSISLDFDGLVLSKPLLFWINDGLMVVFFFYIGLEIKHEIALGELASTRRALLPVIAAFGGMLCPALIFIGFNIFSPQNLNGWAIPTATDIAFAVGILSLFGNRVPIALKILLLSISVIDDVGAVLIIALYYTSELSWLALLFALCSFAVLCLLNRYRISCLLPYLGAGYFLWLSILYAGIHPTLSGILIALTIPLYKKDKSPFLETLRKTLKSWSAFLILPLFAFFNAGVSLENITLNSFFSPLSLGVMLGLFLGKQIGIFILSWTAVKTGLCSISPGVTWLQVYGIACIAGVGFTMSLFIGTLAFDSQSVLYTSRLGVMLGSALSSTVGILVLSYCFYEKKASRN